jgi:carbonic anhydrase/SulP family sulfate permease
MFRDEIAPLHNIRVSTSGFQDHYTIDNQTQFVDYVTKDLQKRLNPHQILEILQDGNERFRTGNQLRRNLGRQIEATKLGQHPLAIILSCIDSRTPSELVFDMGLGDIFSVRIAGNIIGRKVMGSLEFGCAVAGAKLILVMGHTSCGAVTAAVRNACGLDASDIASTCEHLGFVAGEINQSMTPAICREFIDGDDISRQTTIDAVARNNVKRVVSDLVDQSSTLRALLKQEKIAIVGGMYDVSSGKIEIITVDPAGSDL